MRGKIFNSLLVILLLTAFTVPWLAAIVAGKPLGTNPSWTHWPAGTIWGAGLYMENNVSGGCFFGAKTGAQHIYNAPVPGFPPYIWMVFRENVDQAEITRTEPAAPQKYTWYVKMLYNSGDGDNVDAKIWVNLENADTLFIPQDHSIILENTWLGSLNMRLYENLDTGATVNLVDSITRYATLYVDNAVNVTISPEIQQENVGENLTYTVTVKNTGRYIDNYVLENFDNLGWGLKLENTSFLNVGPGENMQTTLTVSVESDEINTVEVVAEGTYARDYGSAIAVGIRYGVDVSISPPSQENIPGGLLEYTVIVANTGTVEDTYNLSAEDNAGWMIWQIVNPTADSYVDGSSENENMNYGDEDALRVCSYGSYLKWQLPAIPGDIISAKINMYCYDNYKTEFTDVCRVENDNWLENEITWNNKPSFGPLEDTIYIDASDRWYSWDVTSWVDNQSKGDNIVSVAFKTIATWRKAYFYSREGIEKPYLEIFWRRVDGLPTHVPLSSLTILPGENRTTTLKITIPEGVPYCTWDNIKVTATSRADNTVSDNGSCLAHVAISAGSDLLFSPPENYNPAGENENVGFILTVKNVGNVEDNYVLTVGDTAGWGLTLTDNLFENMGAGDNQITTLTVTIPVGAELCDWDNVTVTVSSPEPAGGFPENWTRGSRLLLTNLTDSAMENFKFDFEFDHPIEMLENCADLRVYRDLTQLPFYIESRGARVRAWAHYPWSLGGRQTDNLWIYWGNPAAENVENAENVISAEEPLTIATLTTSSSSCIARYSFYRGISISASPDENSAPAGATLNYATTVKNIGSLDENCIMTAVDDANWILGFSDNGFVVPRGENRIITFSVTIPWYAENCTWDNVIVIATAADNVEVTDNDNCVAHAIVERGVEVSVSPYTLENLPRGLLEYTVMVKNTGNGLDNYGLVAVDTQGWEKSFSENWLLIPSGENRTPKLTVTIPAGAENCTWDNITVIATSMADNTVTDNDNCRGHVIQASVEISITPSDNSGALGETLNYQVTVRNTSGGLDTYTVDKIYTRDWLLALENTVTIPPGENRTLTLRVTIPDNESLGAWDNIKVTATSRADNTVSDNGSCIARAGISVSPQSQIGVAGELLTYTVIFCNTSENVDNYALLTTDEYGWPMWFEDNFFEDVPPGENRRTTLMVLICGGGDRIKVTAAGTYASASATVTAAIPIPEIIIHGMYEAYDTDKGDDGGSPWVWYGPSPKTPYPIIMAAREIGLGRVVAGGTVCTCRNTRWNVDATKLDGFYQYEVLLDCVFQWLKPDNTAPIKVLWYGEYEADQQSKYRYELIYNTLAGPGSCSALYSALKAKGYNMDNTIDGAFTPITESLLAPYDILIIPEVQDYVNTGGDPNIWPDDVVDLIVDFVLSGKSLLIMEGTDSFGHNYWRIQNRILDALNFGLYFQSDSVYDDVNNYGMNYTPWCKVDTTTWVGSAYENATGRDDIGLYCLCSMAPLAPAGIYMGIIPDENRGPPGENVSFIVTLANTRSSDNYILTVEDNRGWSLELDDNLFEIMGNGGARTTLRVVGATPRTEDLVTVTVTSQTDENVSDNASCTAWVALNRDVEVSVSPAEIIDLAGEKVSFTVTVKNWGIEADNYDLTIENTENWAWSLPSSVGPLAGGEENEVTLEVSIPEDAELFDNDVLIITATSQADNTVSDNASCVVRVALENWGVRVRIQPRENKGVPGENVNFTVTVTNVGKYADNYNLVTNDNIRPTWSPTISPSSLWLPAASSGEATLTVSIPSTATPCTRDNILVRAASTNARDNDTCIAHAFGETIQVLISPEENTGAPSENVTFIVTVSNIGSATDNYALENSDNAGWTLSLENTLLTVPAGENRTTKLTVTIPENAESCTRDNITVTATSQTDNTLSDNANCIAHAVAAIRGVRISISPGEKSGAPGATVTFIVTVTNTGNVTDNYALENADNAGWTLSLDNASLTVPENGSRTTTLRITIPENAENCTRDNITITVTSRTDNTIENSASCIAHATAPPPGLGVQVSISPSENSGAPGTTVTFTVTVKNTGDNDDSYVLTASDDVTPSWSPTLADDLLTIPAGENRTTTVSVIVPSDAIENEQTRIIVKATSQTDNTVENSATCTAIAGKKAPPELPVIPIVVGGAAVGGGIAVAALLKKGIIHLPSIRSRLHHPRPSLKRR